jgi:hypothetical protein
MARKQEVTEQVEVIEDVATGEIVAANGVPLKRRVLDDVGRVFEVFYLTINPQVQFGNKTHRKAIEDLIRRYGLDTVIAAAQYAVTVAGQPYAPVITTPHQLYLKWAALAVHKKRAENKGPTVVAI